MQLMNPVVSWGQRHDSCRVFRWQCAEAKEGQNALDDIRYFAGLMDFGNGVIIYVGRIAPHPANRGSRYFNNQPDPG
jgi:hypothetical protein